MPGAYLPDLPGAFRKNNARVKDRPRLYRYATMLWMLMLAIVLLRAQNTAFRDIFDRKGDSSRRYR
jgi:hypothetical protein